MGKAVDNPHMNVEALTAAFLPNLAQVNSISGVSKVDW